MTHEYARLDYANANLEILVSTVTEQKSRLASCQREPQTIEWIEQFEDGTAFLDIGANVGCYSLVAAAQNRRGRSGIRVFAIEPAQINFGSLLQNIRRNRMEEVVTPLNIAVSDLSGVGTLYYDGRTGRYPVDEAGSSGHQLNRLLDYQNAPFEPVLNQGVLAISIQDFARIFNVVPNAIKIDVDGIEDLIVAGIGDLLDDRRLRSILVEINNDKADALIEQLHRHGFACAKHARHNNHLFTRQ